MSMVEEGTRMNLANKVALITGAAAGLGRATALEFARRGARLVAVDLDPDGMVATARTVAEMGREIETVTADLSVEADVERAMAATEERFGRLDILVNCAGILLRAGTRVDVFPTAAWQRVIDVNLTGTFFCVKHATPLLERNGGGVMILLASGAGIKGGSYSVAYAASKGGVHGLALGARAQLQPLHIRLHVAIPDTMNTRMRVGATGEYAALRGESRERAEQEEYARLPGPERSAEFLAGLATEEGAQLMGEQLLISVDEWQQRQGQ
jgi:NAD(P)-dependent dehydrogenase (short-subunit alcohol dehydrogenase family)